jgi:mono/diheme cytochrome c family protein
MIFFAAGLFGVALLTSLGWRDRPVNESSATTWTLREIGGRQFAQHASCATCHAADAIADPLESIGVSRGPDWLAGHVADPEMIAPGLREPPKPMSEREITAIVAYVRKLSRLPYPGFDARTETVGRIFGRYCVGCHTIDGEGGTDGPNLSHIGTKHDADYFKRLIDDPEAVNPKAEMPSFGSRLSEEELSAIADYLAGRK